MIACLGAKVKAVLGHASDHLAAASRTRPSAALENAQKRLFWVLKGLSPGTYYWSVQAIDTALAGSSWAAEETVTVP